MIRFDLHTHTTWCDGKDTPEDMVRAALALGLEHLGFSGHGYAPYDTDCCMTPEGEAAYRAEAAALKRRYAGRITVHCGVERDFWAEADTSGYEYVIGAVHYLKAGGEYLCVDNTPELLRGAAERFFGGDMYALCEEYYRTVAQVVEKTDCDIIGHFDLVSKFNEKERLFDEDHPRYAAAWRAALDALLPSGKPFEVNTGAMSRAWRTSPYPSGAMIAYIRAHGGRLVLSSDSHSAKTIAYAFDRYEDALGDSLIRNVEEIL